MSWMTDVHWCITQAPLMCYGTRGVLTAVVAVFSEGSRSLCSRALKVIRPDTENG